MNHTFLHDTPRLTVCILSILVSLVTGCSMLNNARIVKPDTAQLFEDVEDGSFVFIARVEPQPEFNAVALSLYFDGKLADQIGVFNSKDAPFVYGHHYIKLLSVAPEKSGYIVWIVDPSETGAHRVDASITFASTAKYFYFGHLWRGPLIDATYYPLWSFSQQHGWVGCEADEEAQYWGLKAEVSEPGIYYLGDFSLKGHIEKVIFTDEDGEKHPYIKLEGSYDQADEFAAAKVLVDSLFTGSRSLLSIAASWGTQVCKEVEYLNKTE